MNKEDCIIELQSFVLEIQKLLDFIQASQKSLDEKLQAQEMLKTFKKRLETAYKTRDKVQAEKRMTDIEKAYFFPAVHETYANLTITTNSRPGEKWAFELIDAQNTLNYYISQLNQQ